MGYLRDSAVLEYEQTQEPIFVGQSREKGKAEPKPSDKGVAGDAVAAQDPAILKRVAGSSHAEKIFR